MNCGFFGRECESREASNGNEGARTPFVAGLADSHFIKYSLEREGNTRGEKSPRRMLIRAAGGVGRGREESLLEEKRKGDISPDFYKSLLIISMGLFGVCVYEWLVPPRSRVKREECD
ncbi:hypothetical protein MHYP_G00005870 [Metynnis hypsauchen]